MANFFVAINYADTIYFPDGSILRCKIHKENIVFGIKDKDFIEVEVNGGVLGFYKRPGVRVTYDDLYIPQQVHDWHQTNPLKNLPNILNLEELFVAPSGRESATVELMIEEIKGWSYPERKIETIEFYKVGDKISSRKKIFVPPQSRVKLDLEQAITMGIPGRAEVIFPRLQKFPWSGEYNLEINILEGYVWIKINSGPDFSRQCRFIVNKNLIVSSPGLVRIESPATGGIKIARFGGSEITVLLSGQKEHLIVRPNQEVITNASGDYNIHSASEDILKEWTEWDLWSPPEYDMTPPLFLPEVGKEEVLPPLYTGPNLHNLQEMGIQKKLFNFSLAHTFIAYKEALEAFRRDVGKYPPPELGLAVLRSASPEEFSGWNGPYVDKYLPTKDPWGKEFIYEIMDSPEGQKLIDVRSSGPNGIDEKGLGDDLR